MTRSSSLNVYAVIVQDDADATLYQRGCAIVNAAETIYDVYTAVSRLRDGAPNADTTTTERDSTLRQWGPMARGDANKLRALAGALEECGDLGQVGRDAEIIIRSEAAEIIRAWADLLK